MGTPLDLGRLKPQPAGFGDCAGCAYRETGPPAVCHACAAQAFTAIAKNRCEVCQQELGRGEECRNHWCSVPVAGGSDTTSRHFSSVVAIAQMTGPLAKAIKRYKYDDRRAWASIFGRVVLGFLEDHEAEMQEFDLILACPTFVGPGSRSWDHIQLILDKASIEDVSRRWPFVKGGPLLTKTAATRSFVGLGASDRRHEARTSLRSALMVTPIGSKILLGKSVLAFDDVFTDGSTLREVARSLKAAGAGQVSGLVLARQPWTPT